MTRNTFMTVRPVTPAIEQFPSTRFETSVAALDGLPAEGVPEVAFAGRSNAGKSSALNVLCQQRALARTSKTPGRTQLLNYFEVPGHGWLVDLPGYGFARVPAAVRRRWEHLAGGYLRERASLRGVVVVMDARRPLTELDRRLLEWIAPRPAYLLLTKADKLRPNAARQALAQVRRVVPDAAGAQLFSAVTRAGLDDLRAAVAAWLSGDGALPDD